MERFKRAFLSWWSRFGFGGDWSKLDRFKKAFRSWWSRFGFGGDWSKLDRFKKAFRSWWSWFGSDEDWSETEPRPPRFGDLARRRRRRRWFGLLVVLLASVASAVYALGYVSGGEWDLSGASKGDPSTSSQGARGGAGPIPEPPDDPAAVAYWLVASELPGIDPESVEGVYQSTLDPSWASVRITAPEEESIYIVFLQRENDLWKAKKSIRADEPEEPEYEKTVLDEVPKDLVEAVYPKNLATEGSGLLTELEKPGSMPTIEPAETPPPDPVTDDVPESELERVEEGLEEVQQAIEDYEGVAGVYVRDPNGGYGYGVRPDEVFFNASVAKVPIMVAVYRRIDEGAFSLSDSFETESEDWAAGAGWLQWQPAGTAHTVEDYLWMMMTRSDNVATNALLRIVGGPGYVNEVARSLGAPNTVLYQKVTSERAAVMSLDNQSTPRDMATMMEQIFTGRAASRESSLDMVDLMHQNDLESWLEDGLPEGTEVANKAGWLYRVYNEVAIVDHEDRPYVVAILSKQGPEDPEEAKPLLKDISKAIWQTQDS
jgi:beta-lactamase class A